MKITRHVVVESGYSFPRYGVITATVVKRDWRRLWLRKVKNRYEEYRGPL